MAGHLLLFLQIFGVFLFLSTSLIRLGKTIIGKIKSLGQGHEQGMVRDMIEAASEGSLSTLRTLLDGGADVNARNTAGETPLHHAVWSTQHVCILHLLESGADPNAADKNGDTPLHLACREPELPMIEYLLRFGADATLRNKKGETAQEVLCREHRLDLDGATIAYLLKPFGEAKAAANS